MEKKATDTFIEITYALIFVAIMAYTLWVGKDTFIPFVIALVLWYLTISIANQLQALKLFNRKLSGPLALTFSILIGIGIFVFILYMLSQNVSNVITLIPKYQQNLKKIWDNVLHQFHLESFSLHSTFSIFSKNDFINWTTRAAQTLTDVMGLTGIILVYYIFLLGEIGSIERKIDALFTESRKRKKAKAVLSTINQKLQSYMRIKTTLSLATAFLSYLVMYAVGVDFSEFWASLIFLLNYIPTIGSIVATIFPCLLTLIQFDAWLPFFITLLSLSAIQFMVGNILEPRIMGGSFNLSGLIILISLVVWGKIWGVTGMFLCVPITVMAYVILSQFDRTRWIAILLSANGKTL